MRVLVVEDNNDLCGLVSLWLKGIATVRVRGDAESVSDDDIDWAEVALVDYRLPHLDGCSVCTRIKERRPEVRRVLWTADPIICRHADDKLQKPNTLEEIKAMLRV